MVCRGWNAVTMTLERFEGRKNCVSDALTPGLAEAVLENSHHEPEVSCVLCGVSCPRRRVRRVNRNLSGTTSHGRLALEVIVRTLPGKICWRQKALVGRSRRSVADRPVQLVTSAAVCKAG
jgi:hypothetical protein